MSVCAGEKMTIQIFSRTSKNKKSSKFEAYSFGIPAGFAEDGFNTCPGKDSCAHGCYANQGFYVYKKKREKMERNLRLARHWTSLEGFALEVSRELEHIAAKARKPIAIRIHDSGDFFSGSYLHKWIHIIEKFPEIEFYAYTKMIPLFGRWNLQPRPITGRVPGRPNFTVIYSLGGKWDFLINTGVHRHSAVFAKGKENVMEAMGYADASKDDTVAFAGKNHRIGLLYHGNQYGKEWELYPGMEERNAEHV